MVKVLGVFSQLKPAKVLVVGDFMLDTYTTGEVERISPEAPVPVLHVQKSEDVPGGTGNVVLNLLALGAEVIAVGRVGSDLAGKRLKQLLKERGVDTRGIFVQEGVSTPRKNRLIADGQQLIRIDEECVTPLSETLEKKVLAAIENSANQIEVIAISDYAKGFLTPTLLEKVIAFANDKRIPTIVDPKGNDFSKYYGATLIKPNYKEALAASKLTKEAPFEQVGKTLLEESGAKMLMITRSSQGITLFKKEGDHMNVPAKVREVKDVTGAGDTVLAVTTMSFASNITIKETLTLCNIAAGIAIERLGCASISLSELAERLLEINLESKIFDEDHLFALEQALIGKKLTILGINTKEGVSTSLFTQIQKLAKQKKEERLIVYCADSDPDRDLVALLSSLHEVDFIVAHAKNLESLVDKIHPHQVFTLGSDGVLCQVPTIKTLLV